MAHFAELDENNIVIRNVVINNNVLLQDGIEIEQKGIDFCKQLYGENTIWKQTSYNAGMSWQYINKNAFRKNYGITGSEYRPDLDAFIQPKPYPSWVLNEDTCAWEAPIKYPDDGEIHTYDTKNKTWVSDGGTIYYWLENTQEWFAEPHQKR